MPIRFFLLGLCCLFAAAHAAPAATPTTQQSVTPQYSVEVLVFRYLAPVAIKNETWPPSVAAPSLAGAVYPAPAATGAVNPMPAATSAYSALAQSSGLMSKVESRLEAAGVYAVVTELGWRQSADSTQTMSIAPLPASLIPAASASASAPASSAPAAIPPDNAPIKLDGTARFQVQNAQTYVSLNLRLCEPAPPGIVVRAENPATITGAATATFPALVATAAQGFPAMQSATPCFALNENRQVTPGQFEYFDNPIFGALVLVQLITPQTNPAATPPAASAPVQSPAPGSP